MCFQGGSLPWLTSWYSFLLEGLSSIHGSLLMYSWISLFSFSSSVMSDSLNPMNCSAPGFPVLHHLPEFAQIHVHRCHPNISSSVVPFSSCPQSSPSSVSFPMSQFFASGGQSTEGSASASVLPMNIQGWFPLRLTGLTSLLRQLVSPKSHWIKTDTWLPLPALPSSPRAPKWLPQPLNLSFLSAKGRPQPQNLGLP